MSVIRATMDAVWIGNAEACGNGLMSNQHAMKRLVGHGNNDEGTVLSANVATAPEEHVCMYVCMDVCIEQNLENGCGELM